MDDSTVRNRTLEALKSGFLQDTHTLQRTNDNLRGESYVMRLPNPHRPEQHTTSLLVRLAKLHDLNLNM